MVTDVQNPSPSPPHAPSNAKWFGGFSFVVVIIEGRRALQVVGECFRPCGCRSPEEAVAFLFHMNDAMFGGMLLHLGILALAVATLCHSLWRIVRKK